MYTFLTILLLLISILLIAVVLIQPGKGDMITGLGGLSGTFSSMFGSRRAMDLLQKITIGLAAAIAIIVIVINMFLVGPKESIEKPVIEGTEVPMQQAPVPNQIPNAPAPNN